MTNSIKLIAGFVVLLATFLVTPEVQAQGNAEKLPAVMEKNGAYLFTALKMSPADQTALMDLLKGSEASYKLSVISDRNNQSYGSLSGVNLKIKEIAGNKLNAQAAVTCTEVSTDNNCYKVNYVTDAKGLKPATQAQLKALVSKYMR
ncbi:hypothetical protein [Haliscomenobacter hydrossis]|uniref:DUF4252 domain-containing protein n=1 Tax=Haliscomenobacter hydrossis (strain ATCC 27775 / DSM 1100 / LMG 10767 / O) TaxID=760192 RepID=F4L3F3_HALH1|nr:hypothetical protein [Haliscomenobacter hydrossis]AEE52930.1 hypothetical protein Halhy_5104 [Haliscomenobacter hydrossis DSM 1100]